MDKNAFLIDLSERDRTDFGRVDFAQQSTAQKTFSAIWELESQVNNGGFDQYFRNSDSNIIEYAPAALRQISAASCATIVDSAIQLISPIPSDEGRRHNALDEAGKERLDELDAQFYGYPDDITGLLFAFVSKHPAEFGTVQP